jgi:hypothetical protein
MGSEEVMAGGQRNRTFRLEHDNVLECNWRRGVRVLNIDLGVPRGTIAEEPGYDIELSYDDACALRDWLVEMLPRSPKRSDSAEGEAGRESVDAGD